MTCFRFLCFTFALLCLMACSKESEEPVDLSAPAERMTAEETYEEKDDLPALQKRKALRILVQAETEKYLPRDGFPLEEEKRLAEECARRNKLRPVFVSVPAFEDLIPALLEGKGDMIAQNMTVTDSRRERVAFTLPLGHTREEIVAQKNHPDIVGASDLRGKTIGIQAGTSFAATAMALQKQFSDIHLEVMPGTWGTTEMLDAVVLGDVDYIIEDRNVINTVFQWRDDVRVLLDVSKDRPLAWAVRPDSNALLSMLNQYLTEYHVSLEKQQTSLADLESIRNRKVLRLLTRNNGATYFLWRGELLGFEYEMAKKFADALDLRLRVVVAPSHEDLIPMLLEGKGDFIGSFMTINNERKERGVAFSRPYHISREIVVTREGDNSLKSLVDLKGRVFYVRKWSSYWQTLKVLQQEKGIGLKIRAVPEDMETEEIIYRVAEGEFDLTLADEHILSIEQNWLGGVRGAFALAGEVEHGWAVRQGNPDLLAAMDAFWKKTYKTTFYNVVAEKYFGNEDKIRRFKKGRVDLGYADAFSPYDDLVRRYANDYRFDWRMIVSQMYQESRFDPQAKSPFGAIGLMQVLPQTGKEMGFSDIQNPENSIHAGVKYLDATRSRFRTNITISDRLWFSLAAYNAGLGHVIDARRLSRQMGWSYNIWFDNVEKAMLLLSKKPYYQRARHGYVRGWEPVRYVRQIRDRWEAYVLATEKAASGLN